MMTFLVILVVRRFRILESVSLIFIVITVASASPIFMSARVAWTGGLSAIILLFVLKVVRFSHG